MQLTPHGAPPISDELGLGVAAAPGAERAADPRHARSHDHLAENVAAGELTLTGEMLVRLEGAGAGST